MLYEKQRRRYKAGIVLNSVLEPISASILHRFGRPSTDFGAQKIDSGVLNDSGVLKTDFGALKPIVASLNRFRRS